MKTESSKVNLSEKNRKLTADLEQTRKDLDDQNHFTDSLFDALREGCLILDENFYVKSVNTAFCELFNVDADETRGELLYDLGNRQWNIPELRNLLENMLPENKEINDYEITHDFEDIGSRVMILNARRIDHLKLILLAIEDVTERKKALQELNKSRDTLEERVEERTRQVRKLATRLTRSEHEERSRISELLHDDLQQLLVAVNMNLKAISEKAKQPGADPKYFPEQLSDSISMTNHAIDKTRQLTHDLNPAVLQSRNLTSIIKWLTGRFEEMYDLKTDLKIPEDLQIPNSEARVILLQILRELLFNIVKHAGTDHAIIKIRDSEEDYLAIHVIDKGEGFDENQIVNKESFGLFNVRDRLNLFGGKLNIDSSPGSGTRMTIHFPVEYLIAEG